MPTFEVDSRFWRDYDDLTLERQRQFLEAKDEFVQALLEAEANGCRMPPSFPNGLRVKPCPPHRGVRELTWAADGRCTWMYGNPRKMGQYHIIWRRIGSHDIYDAP